MNDTAPAFSRTRRKLFFFFLIWSAVLAVYVAWISDDAMITLVQVRNFVLGDGMVFNLGQRVQAFTHPTWFFLLSGGYALSGSLYVMSAALSIVVALAALAVYFREALSGVPALNLAIALMLLPLCSRGIVDYLASGLENPLSFLLVALIFLQIDRMGTAGADRLLWLLMALAVLTRMDHALQFLPLALWLFLAHRPLAQLGRALPGIALLLAWFAFATWYFGSPLPNTAYGKLSAGLRPDQIDELALDFWHTALFDTPATLFIILAGAVLGLIRPGVDRLLVLGVLAHLLYLDRIGGDFMMGRMLSVDAFIACFLILRAAALIPARLARPALPLLFVLALFRLADTIMPIVPMQAQRVIDERQFYYPGFGLLAPERALPAVAPRTGAEQAHVLTLCGMLGMTRLRAPDEVWIVDLCGLADPFLARMPGHQREFLRPGHMVRAFPRGYEDSVLAGAPPGISDAERALHADLALVTRAPLDADGRLAAIWRLNTTDYAIAPEPWRRPRLSEDICAPLHVSNWLTVRPDRPEVEITIGPIDMDLLSDDLAGACP